jgi:primosomal protein N'
VYLRPPLASPARLAALEAERLAARGQVLVLAPTVRLLEDVLAEFTSGAARLDSKARAGSWNGWRSGGVRVGIGTRSAAFYSARTLAGIVVVEDEHPGHMESSLPYTNARDIAKRRAALHRCPCTFISAAPSPSAMASSKVLTLPDAKRFWPQVQIVPRSADPVSDRSAVSRLKGIVDRSDLPVVAIVEARPSRRVCTRCGDPRPCSDCDTFCTHRETTPCPRCATFGVRWSGWDRARTSATLPGVRAVTFSELVQLPTTPHMVLFPGVDSLLAAPSLSPLHDASSALLRVAECAGIGGRLVLVTDNPDHAAVRALRLRDCLNLSKEVWDAARTGGLPPFGHLVTVRVGREKPPRTDRWPGRVFGPRRRDKEWEVLVKVTASELVELRGHLDSLRSRGKTRIRVE